jgi:hypothetical protein
MGGLNLAEFLLHERVKQPTTPAIDPPVDLYSCFASTCSAISSLLEQQRTWRLPVMKLSVFNGQHSGQIVLMEPA